MQTINHTSTHTHTHTHVLCLYHTTETCYSRLQDPEEKWSGAASELSELLHYPFQPSAQTRAHTHTHTHTCIDTRACLERKIVATPNLQRHTTTNTHELTSGFGNIILNICGGSTHTEISDRQLITLRSPRGSVHEAELSDIHERETLLISMSFSSQDVIIQNEHILCVSVRMYLI